MTGRYRYQPYVEERPRGKPRRVTDDGVRKLREWKTFAETCREIGICVNHGRKIRQGEYQHRQPSP